jgi:hypothetical protein
MSDRHRPDQIELFRFAPAARSAGLINGLEVLLERPCHRCGGRITVIIEGRGSHSAALECAQCGRFRQWLAREACAFLMELVRNCGRPVEPIRLFEQVHRPNESLPP